MIELTRANRSAQRQHKSLRSNAELLRREKGLPQYRVRAMAVALKVAMAELLAPLNNLV